MDIVAFLMTFVPANHVGQAAAAITTAVTVCSLIDKHFPQPGPGSVWVKPRKVITWIAQNVKYAANATPAGTPK